MEPEYPKGIPESRGRSRDLLTRRIESKPTLQVKELAVLMAQTPGRQTVPRAEVWALAKTREAAGPGVVKEAPVDADYVTEGLAAEETRQERIASTNGDVWKQLLSAMERRPDISIAKVK